jgi:hypothetical protein
MPTIPIGNFGQAIARPERAPRVTAAGAGQIDSEAAARLGQTATNIAIDQMAQQTKIEKEARDREAQTTAARVRIQKHNDLDAAQEQLSADILSGKVAKADAETEWQSRTQSILSDATTGLDQRYAGVLQVELEGRAGKGLSGVRQAVTTRDREDTKANVITLGEQYQRMAVKDRPAAVAEYSALLDNMGPAAGWGPDDIALRKQKFREDTAYTEAFTLVRGSANSLDGVRKAKQALAGDGYADIDPQRRAALDAQLDGYETNILQRQAIAEQRAAARAEAAMNRARAAFEASQARVSAGVPDSPDQIAITTQALAGTPFLDTYKQLQQQARQIGGFAAQPVQVQRAALDQVNAQIAKQGASDALIKQRDMLQRVHDATLRDYAEDALRAGLSRGVIADLPAIDVRSVDGFARSVSQRLEAAKIVETRYGRPVSPLTADEAQQFAQTLAALPVQQRATALATIGTQLGPQASAGLAAQIDKQDKGLSLALQYGSSKTTAGRYTSELILKGQAAIKDKAVKVDAAAESGWKGQITKLVDGAYANERQAADVREAAYLITAGMAAEGSVDPARAVRLAAGGEIVEHNGKKVPLPAGMSQGDLEARLRSLKPQDFTNQAPGGVVRVGGQETTVDAFVSALPDAQLISIGRGRYAVQAGGRVVTNAQGRPITVTAKP